MLLGLLACWVGCCLGNCAYAAWRSHDWDDALKISFFQGVAFGIGAIWVVVHT